MPGLGIAPHIKEQVLLYKSARSSSAMSEKCQEYIAISLIFANWMALLLLTLDREFRHY